MASIDMDQCAMVRRAALSAREVGGLLIRSLLSLGLFHTLAALCAASFCSGLSARSTPCRIGGRPPALDAIKVRAAKAMASGTMTASEIARQIGCSPSTLYRHVPGGRTAVAESGKPAAP
jgi:hypothetical protein